jgi:Bacterial archaeo-eukaryotic release factor family 10
MAKSGQPYITPLLQTLDAQKHYGVVFIDEARWRYFEISFGQIEEVQDAFRALGQMVIAPYSHDQSVYVCSETLYVTASLGALERNCPEQHHELALLQDVLPDLIASHGARLTYLHDGAEDTLVHTFAGLAGLKRW